MDQFIGTGRRVFGLAWDPSEVDVINSSEVGEVTTSEVGVVNSRRWVWLPLVRWVWLTLGGGCGYIYRDGV